MGDNYVIEIVLQKGRPYTEQFLTCLKEFENEKFVDLKEQIIDGYITITGKLFRHVRYENSTYQYMHINYPGRYFSSAKLFIPIKKPSEKRFESIDEIPKFEDENYESINVPAIGIPGGATFTLIRRGYGGQIEPHIGIFFGYGACTTGEGLLGESKTGIYNRIKIIKILKRIAKRIKPNLIRFTLGGSEILRIYPIEKGKPQPEELSLFGEKLKELKAKGLIKDLVKERAII